PDRALDQHGEVRKEGLRPAQAPGRKSRRPPPRQGRRQADEALAEAGGLPRPRALRPLQAGSLPVLRLAPTSPLSRLRERVRVGFGEPGLNSWTPNKSRPRVRPRGDLPVRLPATAGRQRRDRCDAGPDGPGGLRAVGSGACFRDRPVPRRRPRPPGPALDLPVAAPLPPAAAPARPGAGRRRHRPRRASWQQRRPPPLAPPDPPPRGAAPP